MASGFWTLNAPDLTRAWARAKQLAAGAAEATIANSSETPGNYRPAVVDAIPAAVGLVAQLAKGKQFSGDNAAERYINDSVRRANLASQRTNRTLGIDNPKDTNELALRIAGSLAIPSPKIGAVTTALEKLPYGVAAVRAATAATKATPKVVRGAAKVAAEIATPLRQTTIGKAGLIGGALTGGLDVLMDQSVDPSTGQRYDGSVREALGIGEAKPEEVATATPQVSDDPEIAGIDDFMHQQAVQLGDVDEVASIDAAMANEPTEHEATAHEEENKLSRFSEAALAIGAVLTGGAVLKYGGDFLKARSAAATDAENVLPKFTGKAYRTSRGGVLSKAKARFVQQDEPIRNMAEDFLGRTYAKQWGYRADRMTNVSIGARTKHFFQTGITPTVETRTVKLAPLAEAYAKELDPQEQRLVSDALNAASALDDYRATGVHSALNKDMEGNPVTPTQLEALVQTVTSNPKYSKYFNAIQKSYDDLLKYRVLRGRDTHAEYLKLRERRPNYVAMNRNLEGDAPFATETRRYSANTDQGLGAARSLEEGGGIQGPTGVGNPFLALFDEWSNEVRRSDLNDLRADFLVNMDASGALNRSGYKIIEKVTPNRTDDDIHRVRINGHEEAYKVRDPEVARALHMSPRASIKLLEGLRQVQQSATTGPLASVFNMFAATKSPIYDAMIANLARPKGVKLGLLNRTMLGGYTGAARYMWDDMRGAMATSLRDAMIRDNSWLKGLLGDKNLDNLATMFENAYENSIKADLDRYGISSATMHGSPDASQLSAGVEQVAPHFAQASQEWIRDDIARAAVNGDLGPVKAAIATSKSAYATANASRLARVYGSVIEALHNGVRYSAHAANKGSLKNLEKHISDMRRLSADSSQHGGSDTWNRIFGSMMYANLGMQSLYEVGKRAVENPATFLVNVGTTVGTLAAMHYAALGSDPDAMEKHKLKTPQQKAISLTTFGGAEMPLDPVTRLVVAPLFALYDQMSGVNTGDYNPNFFKVMESWLEGETHPQDEASQEEAKIGLWEAVKANNPIAPSAFPPASIALASAGVDPGMSRMTDETMMEQTQRITGLEDDTRRPDALMSAHMENMITAMLSTAGRSILQMTDDMYRAWGKSHDLSKSIDVGLSRWRDTAQKGAGLAKPLFGDYPAVESASDTNFQLLREREPGIEQAIKVLNTDVKGEGITGLSPRNNTGWMPQEQGVAPPPEIRGTELEYISSMAKLLNDGNLAPHQQILNTLGKQIEGYNAFYMAPISDRNVEINKINHERRYQRLFMLNIVKDYEEKISDRIGRPFTFKDFNPKEYLNPLPPAQ